MDPLIFYQICKHLVGTRLQTVEHKDVRQKRFCLAAVVKKFFKSSFLLLSSVLVFVFSVGCKQRIAENFYFVSRNIHSIRWLTIVLSILIVGGCAKKQYLPIEVTSLKLPKNISAANDRTVIKLEKKLAACGVKVITIGQEYMLSIPANKLFPENSPRLKWEGQAILTNVGDFLKQFRKISIYVMSYSNKCISIKREHALTLTRARAVANNLWEQDLDSRLIFTVGAGSDKPIIMNMKNNDNQANARIEIIFRETII